MLSYTDIKSRVVIILDRDPYEVLTTSGVVKKQRQKPHLSAKLKNLKTGSVIEKTFTQADKVQEAELRTKELKFIYTNRGEVVFAEPDDPSARSVLGIELLRDKLNYIKEGDIITMQIFDDEIIGIKLPIKVELKVAEAPPNIRGNTSAGGNKVVVLETGLKVTTPLFIEVEDSIKVNTETGEYVSRN